MAHPSSTFPPNWSVGAFAPTYVQTHTQPVAQPPAHVGLHPSQTSMKVVQQPLQALVATTKGKTRKPIDPPAVLQLHITGDDPSQQWMSNPFLFTLCRLVSVDGTEMTRDQSHPNLIGAQTSSLYRLKDAQNAEGGFFIFGDLSATLIGNYKLRFSLFENQAGFGCQLLCEADSDVFEVMSAKKFPGLNESTVLSRIFSDQGVRLRLRKETKGGQEKRRAQEEARDGAKGHEHSQSEDAPSPRKRSRYETNERQDVFGESSNARMPAQIPRAYPTPMPQYSQHVQTNFTGSSYPSSMPYQFRGNAMGAHTSSPFNPMLNTNMPSAHNNMSHVFAQQTQDSGLPSMPSDFPEFGHF